MILITSAFQSPCESFPCQHGGTCRALYDLHRYRCTCKQTYNGKNCEEGELLWASCEIFCYSSKIYKTKSKNIKANIFHVTLITLNKLN